MVEELERVRRRLELPRASEQRLESVDTASGVDRDRLIWLICAWRIRERDADAREDLLA